MKGKNSSVDLFALRRDKEMTPGARLDWLAAAWQFVKSTEKAKKKATQKDQEG